jgi:uncharacterized membrane protein
MVEWNETLIRKDPMWILYGLLAASSFGVAAVFQKLAARSPVQVGVWEVLIFQGLATIAIGVMGFLVTKQAFTKAESPAYAWAALTGAALTIGALCIFLTYRAAGANADAGRIQALINTNTLIALVLGLVFLREYTHLVTAGDWLRLVAGAVLVVLGGIVLTWSPSKKQAAAAVVHPHATHAHVQLKSNAKLPLA